MDPAKIAFVLSFITAGEAQKWKEQFMHSITSNNKMMFPTFGNFMMKLQDAFKAVNPVDSAMQKLATTRKLTGGRCYISFSLSSFTNYPDVPIPLPMLLHFLLIILPHVTLSAFILISGFKCFSNVPNFYMCSHLPFHMFSSLFPCALTLFMTISELL